MKRVLLLLVVATLVMGVARARAGQLGTQLPPSCSAHISFDGGPDFAGDYRCAGIAIEYHTSGVAYSPGPIWAGQWLFVDASGQFRVGSCVFNRGLHPTIAVPSTVVAQSFPNDPTGQRSAYLTWRYGDTTDNLTAAGMWAAMHYYAQDGAGSRRAIDSAAPLVPSLDAIAAASGRDDVQAMAIALDAEAAVLGGAWTIAATVDSTGSVDAVVTAADQPVQGAAVTLLVSGRDDPITLVTGVDGHAQATVTLAPGTTTIVASTHTPGAALVYRGRPAGPDPHGAQRLVTGGAPTVVSASAAADVPHETSTTTNTTTTPATTTPATTASTTTPATTTPATTTSTTTTAPVPPTTTSTSTTSTTSSSSTSTTSTTTSTTPPTSLSADTTAVADTMPTTSTVAVLAPVPGKPLPKTGKSSAGVSYLATALLVAGIGIVGVASRRSQKGAHLHSAT